MTYSRQPYPLDSDLLQAEEVKALVRRYQQTNDPEALERIVAAHWRLIHKAAMRYVHVAGSLTLEDLKQHGVIGLMRAARKFDETRGTVFSTVATWWVRQEIHRAVQDFSGTIRVSVPAQDRHNRLKREAGSEEAYERLVGMMSAAKQKTTRLAAQASMTISLNMNVRNDNGNRETELGDLIPDPNGTLAEDAATDHQQAEAVAKLLGTLDDRTREIIRLHYWEGMTAKEIGKKYGGLTRQRVMQIIWAGVDRMKNSPQAARLT